MLEVALLLTQIVVTFSLCMGAFRGRQTFGMAPLFLTLGALEGMKYLAMSKLLIQVPYLGHLFPGSAVFYVGSLSIILVVYVREGLTTARQIIWAMLYVSVALSLLTLLCYVQLQLPGATQLVPYSPELFITSAWWQVLGTILLFGGTLACIILYNALGRFSLPLFVRMSISLSIVVAIDSVLFDLAARGLSTLTAMTFLPNMLAKITSAILYSFCAVLYLRYLDPHNISFEAQARSGKRELVEALTYQRQIADLERELQRDPLTGAFNRRFLDRTLVEQLEIGALRGDETSILLFDLDHFKAIDDTHGHLVGDLVLKHVTQLLTRLTRRGDSVIRLGGEEFLVLLPVTGAQDAIALAQTMLTTLSSVPFRVNDQSITLTATIGVATAPEDGRTSRHLLKCADDRMYYGKRIGRNRVVAEDEEPPDGDRWLDTEGLE